MSPILEGIHTGLDFAGFIPGLGAIPDLANAALYAAEGDAAMAALSAVAAVPGIGDGVKAGAMAVKGGKALLKQAAKQTAKESAEQAAKKTEKEIAEKLIEQKAKKKAAQETAVAGKKKGAAGAKINGKKKKLPPRYKRKKKNKKAEKGEPVYAITGEVIVEQNDFTLPGLIPLSWDRYYGSQNKKAGCCGVGWESPADARLVAEGNDVAFYDGTSEGILFASPLQELPVQETTQGAILDRKDGCYTVTVKSGLTYHFSVKQDLAQGIGVERLTDRSGNWIKYERDGNGLSRIHTNTGHVIDVASRGGLIEKMILRTNGEEERLLVRYEYNGKKELLAVYDALDVPYRFEYGGWGMTRHTNRNGLSFIYEYDEQGRCVYSCGDNNLYKYRFEYLPDRKTRVTDSLGHVSTLSYDENELLLGETDPLGNETRYEYNESFLTSAVIDPLGRRTQYAYNDAGDVTEITRPDGERTRFFYDALQHLTHVIEPSGNTWRQEWDAQGKLIKQITPGGAETRYVYDTRCVLKAVVDANGCATFCKTDTHGNIIGVTDALGHKTGLEVDALGNILSQTDPAGNVTRYAYDAKSRLTKVTRPAGHEVICHYDAEDNLTAYINEAGETTRLAYTGTGELSAKHLPDGGSVHYHYDTEERLTGLTNARGEHHNLQRDALGRITKETGYWGNTTQYAWDVSGRLLQRTDALGNTIRYAYDPLDRLIGKVFSGGREETFAWDSSGNLIRHDNGQTVAERTFDPDGRILEEKLGGITVKNEYDLAGNRIRRTSSHGNIVEYQYDASGNATGIVINGKHTAIERNALGLRAKETFAGNHLHKAYEYNSEGRLTNQSLFPEHSREYIKREYQYDVKGNLLSGKTIRNRTFGAHSIEDTVSSAFTYDACDRLIKFTDPEGRIKEYLYDKAGDLEHKRENGNQREERIEHAGNTQYTYNALGQQTRRKGEKGDLACEWDEAGCLMASTNSDKIKTEYAYDAQYRRISKTTGGKKTLFGWDGNQLLSYTEDGKAKEIVYYPGTYEPFALIETPECVYYYNNDNIGLPREMVDDQGRVYWSAEYDATGRVVKESGAINNPLRFQGQFFDRETGLHYNHHRYYDPDRCRFISQDPLGLAAGENVYAYAPNVWGWIDPLGLCKKKDISTKQLSIRKKLWITILQKYEWAKGTGPWQKVTQFTTELSEGYVHSEGNINGGPTVFDTKAGNYGYMAGQVISGAKDLILKLF